MMVGALQAGVWPKLTLALKLALTFVRKRLKLKLVPDPSARTQTVIGALGRETPELVLTMAGSFQALMSPSKIPATALPSSLRRPATPETFVGTVIAPSRVGK